MFDILEQYDVLLVDAYGVFWDGSDFIEGTKDTLKTMVDKGKTVVILSNGTQRSDSAIKKYAKLGLRQGEHYHVFVTSGEVARKALEDGLVMHGRRCRKYYTFGTQNQSLFDGLDYEPASLEESDFVYISIPQLTLEQTRALPEGYPLYESCLVQPDQQPRFDTTDVAAFTDMLTPIVEASLPVLNANPDLVAPERCKASNTKNFVIRQGSIAHWLEHKGLHVHQFGKPYDSAYAFCRDLLIEKYGLASAATVAMVGDTLETDILGAHYATKNLGWSVDSILTLTGNFGRSVAGEDGSVSKKRVAEQIKKSVCTPTYIITTFGVHGHRYGGDDIT